MGRSGTAEVPPESPGRGGAGRLSRYPAPSALLLIAMAGVAMLLIGVLAWDVGPLVAHPPARRPPAGQPREQPAVTLPGQLSDRAADTGGAWLGWVAAVLAGLLVAWCGYLLLRALRRFGRRPAAPIAAKVTVRSGPSLGAQAAPVDADFGADRSFDSQRAADDIIASWTWLEEHARLAGSPRRPASTPTEFLGDLTARWGDRSIAAGPSAVPLGDIDDEVLSSVSGGTPATAVLLQWYHRARFDIAALAPGAATLVRQAATELVATWPPSSRSSS